jgi:ABC-type nitrate/sulfonate/bicarbonate transport system substrate-binding protein
VELKEEKMTNKIAAIIIGFLFLMFSLPIVQAQQKELQTVELNVFREDPVTLMARLKGFFANEGLAVKVTVTANSTDQMRGLSKGTYHVASTSS